MSTQKPKNKELKIRNERSVRRMTLLKVAEKTDIKHEKARSGLHPSDASIYFKRVKAFRLPVKAYSHEQLTPNFPVICFKLQFYKSLHPL